jgi:hypothetical protein
LGSNTKCPKVLYCYDFVNKVIDEEENVLLVAEVDWFAIGTTILPKSKILMTVVANAKVGIHFLFPPHTRRIFNRHYIARIKV